jgi:hypothetical protein
MTVKEIWEKIQTVEPLGEDTSLGLPDVEGICKLAEGLPKGASVLEIGTCCGRSAFTWAWATGGDVWTIDVNNNRAVVEAHAKRFGLENKIHFFCADSLTFVWDTPIDVLWIDANHDAKHAGSDIRRFGPYAKKLICGHDYGRRDYPDVKNVVDGMFDDIKNIGGIWYKYLEPEISVLSLFIGRMYSLDKYFESLDKIDYPKKRIHLIWHDTSHIPLCEKSLNRQLAKIAPKYASVKLIVCPDKHYHFEEKEWGALDAITNAYNHCLDYALGDYALAFEDDIWADSDLLKRLIDTFKDPKVRVAAPKIYPRPSVLYPEGNVIAWNFKKVEIFPGEGIEFSHEIVRIKDDEKNEIIDVGATHLGFTLIDMKWLKEVKFSSGYKGIQSGCDVVLGYTANVQGYKVMLDKGRKLRHYDIDGSYV